MDSLCHVGRSGCLHYRVRSINPIPLEGFSSDLAEMFSTTRECVPYVTSRSRSQFKVKYKKSNIRRYAVSAM